jgi:hypothetical protein
MVQGRGRKQSRTESWSCSVVACVVAPLCEKKKEGIEEGKLVRK